MTIEEIFLAYSADKLSQSLDRIETCVSHLTPQQLWTRHSENENAAGNLLIHLEGNVRQWILHGVCGQPDQRDRDGEFAAVNGDAAALLRALRSTVEEAIARIQALHPARLLDRVQVQGYGVTMLEAIYHVVEHFSGHTFQIILLTKLHTGHDMGFYAHLGGKAPRQNPLP